MVRWLTLHNTIPRLTRTIGKQITANPELLDWQHGIIAPEFVRLKGAQQAGPQHKFSVTLKQSEI